jgi:broad specificity phosphatase PhoE
MEIPPRKNVIESVEPRFEREKFEKLAIFIRHPNVRPEDFQKALGADDEVPWDALEDRFLIERTTGHEMSQKLAMHLVEEIPEITKYHSSTREFQFYSSPIHRAKTLARYVARSLKSGGKDGLAVPQITMSGAFEELRLGYSKKKIVELLDRAKGEGKTFLEVLAEHEPAHMLARLNTEKERILGALKSLEDADAPVSIVFCHRGFIGLMTYIIEHPEETSFTQEDLVGIIRTISKIPNTSETEIGWKDDKWQVLRYADVPHLAERTDLIKGVE